MEAEKKKRRVEDDFVAREKRRWGAAADAAGRVAGVEMREGNKKKRKKGLF